MYRSIPGLLPLQEGGVRESDKSWIGFQRSDRGGTEWHSKQREAFEDRKLAAINHGDGGNGLTGAHRGTQQ